MNMYSYLYLILSALWIMALSVDWLCVIHPLSIFTLFASPVVVLRRSPPPPFSHNHRFYNSFFVLDQHFIYSGYSFISLLYTPHPIIPLKHFPLYYMWTFLLSPHTFCNSYTLFMIYHFTLSYDKIDSIYFLYHIYHPRVFNVIRWVLMGL